VTAPTVVVTGGASGIGAATVARFLDDGWTVVAADLNDASGERLLAEHDGAAKDGRLLFARCDVAEEEDIRTAIATAVSAGGRLDCLVNNAGVGGAFGPVTEISVEDWDYTFAVLSRAVFLGIKHAARVMREQPDGGSIVNVASLAALTGDAGPQTYSAAKASVLHMSRVFATELGPDRIRVNCVCPGVIATPLNPAASEEFEGSPLATIQPLPYVGRPEHLAGAIAFLAGPDSTFITGQYLAVDGGMEAAGPRLGSVLGTDPRSVGLVGVSRGSTGQRATVHRKVGP
jgi:NAD(P)-dependent dehydrogenase (short-subunit alcohol dehydrogenase family)